MSNIDSLYFTDSGPVKGVGYPTIVFLHGFFMDSRSFIKQVEYFKLKYRVICIDIRGFGLSATKGKPYSLYEIIDDVVNVIDHLKIEKFVLCGVSMGGYIAIRASLLYKERICGMILISTQAGKDNISVVNEYHRLIDGWDDVEKRMVIVDNISSIIFGNACSESIYWKKIWLGYSYNDLSIAMDAMISRDDVHCQLKKITIPVLVIHGELDKGIPKDAGIYMAGEFKYSRTVIINTASHAINITHPDTLNNVIAFWLNDYF